MDDSPHAWADPLEGVDTRDPDAVVRLLTEAAQANRDAACRRGSIDVAPTRGTLLATGDIHDNPLHLARVMRLARLESHTDASPRHVILHEVIHPDHLVGGMDMSHRALLRVAAIKLAFPEQAHTLLANHELSQVVGAGIIKDGVRVVDAFNEGVAMIFHDEAERVQAALEAFIRSMPLALRSEGDDATNVLCAHSLPAPTAMARFDAGILERDIHDDDYTPLQGSAHMMVWGRRQTPEQLETLAARWGVGLFLLGHQKAETGASLMPPNAVILNSDHERGVALPVDLADPPSASDALWSVIPLQSG
jgi:hypothetical protein